VGLPSSRRTWRARLRYPPAPLRGPSRSPLERRWAATRQEGESRPYSTTHNRKLLPAVDTPAGPEPCETASSALERGPALADSASIRIVERCIYPDGPLLADKHPRSGRWPVLQGSSAQRKHRNRPARRARAGRSLGTAAALLGVGSSIRVPASRGPVGNGVVNVRLRGGVGLVAGRDAAREVELAHRARGAVADGILEAVLVRIEAEKRSPARLESIGLGATFDTPEHLARG
jgi:hypothetical protein